ncbi:MAG: response regulator transcription factor [Bacillota bacterium]
MDNKALILIVEDDEPIASLMSAVLQSNGYDVIKAAKGQEALSITASHCPELILLDLGLPDIDGMEVLKSVRQWAGVPIVVVSARGHEREKVEALDLGADDYILKPFGTAELLARIRAALRRSRRDASSFDLKSMRVGDLEINDEKRLVTLAGKEIHLTPIEYKILALLFRHAGKVLTRDTIIREIWGPYANEVQSLRVNMANIRRKIEENPAEPKYIITEVGVGYRMAEEL